MGQWLKTLVGSSCLLLGLGCEPAASPPQTAFYHWTTGFTYGDTAQRYVDSLEVAYLYLRAFDIDWDAERKQAVPLATLEQFLGAQLELPELVPTIFITNRTFQQESLDISRLAQRTADRLEGLFGWQAIREVQIDCDWSIRTQLAYFEFLKALKTQLPERCQLSATIRLHQLRYPDQTGVPPVDRGMLMFYNMGSVSNPAEPNSILNLAAAEPYLTAGRYSLPLDLALPLFRWGVLFREGRMIRLINQLESADLSDTSRFERLDSSHYRVRRSTYLEAYYLYQDDELRLEWVSPATLEAAVTQLRARDWSPGWRLSFYHIDPDVLNHYAPQQLQHLVKAFQTPDR